MNPLPTAQEMYITSCTHRPRWLIQLNVSLSIRIFKFKFRDSWFLLQPLWQVPTASVAIEGASALNRVRWAQGGKEVAVGDSEGRIWIYDVGEVHLIWFGCFDFVFWSSGFFFFFFFCLYIWFKYLVKLLTAPCGPWESSLARLQISIDFSGSLGRPR